MDIELENANNPESPPETTKNSSKKSSGLEATKKPKSGLASVDFKNLRCTRKDFHLSLLMTLVTFGDAVEIYLPGVITQYASRELGVSQAEEGMLGIILYLCLGISYFILPVIKDKRKSPAKTCTTWELFAFTLGGGWIAVLGYLLLGKIGWRYFIVCSSLPVFLPPIFLLHCVLTERTEEERTQLYSDEKTEEVEITGFWGRLIKGSLVNFINTLQGWGSILLIPALLSYINKERNSLTDKQQLLILALLYGVAKLLGRILSIFLLKYIAFRILQPLLSIFIALSYLSLIFLNNNLTATVLAMGVANMCFCVTRCELTLMEFDKHHFGTERLVLAAGVMSGCGMLGAVVGAVAAQFLSSYHAVIFTFVLSCVQVVVFCTITERY
ncbi:hypothetical protein ACHWQZ_G003804 [Mnemiopsis leidyi]